MVTQRELRGRTIQQIPRARETARREQVATKEYQKAVGEYETAVTQQQAAITQQQTQQRFQQDAYNKAVAGMQELMKGKPVGIRDDTPIGREALRMIKEWERRPEVQYAYRKQAGLPPGYAKPTVYTIYDPSGQPMSYSPKQYAKLPPTPVQKLKRELAYRYEPKPVSMFVPTKPISTVEQAFVPAWRKSPLERASYELRRAREAEIQRPSSAYIKVPKRALFTVGTLALIPAQMVVHPIEAVKGVGRMIISPKETIGIPVGRALRQEPTFALGMGAGMILGAKVPIMKPVTGIAKVVSPKYVKPSEAGLVYGKYTEVVPLKKQLALAGREVVVTQVSPTPWFKPFRKTAEIRPAMVSEISPIRKAAGEVYSYWAPPTVTGKPKALLGFGGITTTAEKVGLIYALKHPKKVKFTLFGKPTAEIKMIKGVVEPVPKRFGKPSVEAEKAYAGYIMKEPAKLRMPAEVLRVTRGMEKAGKQEYQVVLAPTTLRKVEYKWTEIGEQKVKIVKAEIVEPVPIIKPTKVKPVEIVEPTIITKPGKIKIEKPYYEPLEYYPLKPTVKVPYYPKITPYKPKPILFPYYPKITPYKPTTPYPPKPSVTYEPIQAYEPGLPPYKPKPSVTYEPIAPYYQKPTYRPSYAPTYYPRPPVSPIPRERVDVLKSALRKIKEKPELIVPEVRRYGKWKPLGEPTTFLKAKERAIAYVKTTLGASFRMKKGEEIIPLGVLPGEFRPAKIVPTVAVERRKYRLSAPSEISEIIVAKKQKGVKSRWL